MKRRDFIADHIINKGFIEDLMKSITWATLCGAVFALSMSSLKSSHYFQGLFTFLFFAILTTISVMYVALYIVIPLDSTMYPNDPYWDEKAKSLAGIPRFVEIIKVFIARKNVFYISLCVGYFFYANSVANYLATKP